MQCIQTEAPATAGLVSQWVPRTERPWVGAPAQAAHGRGVAKSPPNASKQELCCEPLLSPPFLRGHQLRAP